MPQVSELRCNMKEVTQSYDEELSLSPAQLAYLEAQPASDRQITSEEEDELDKQFALSYIAAEPARWKREQTLWQGRENEEMRMVNILHPHTIFRKLRRAGVDARIEAPSYWTWDIDHKTGLPTRRKRERSIGRLWLHDEAILGRVGVSAWVRDRTTGERKRKMVTTLQYPYSPEWSLIRFDQYDVPIGERYRGWRTAMCALITEDVLTEEEVNRAFGPPLLNDASVLYREYLYNHRKRRYGLVQ
jgi:hypothetical protein